MKQLERRIPASDPNGRKVQIREMVEMEQIDVYGKGPEFVEKRTYYLAPNGSELKPIRASGSPKFIDAGGDEWQVDPNFK